MHVSGELVFECRTGLVKMWSRWNGNRRIETKDGGREGNELRLKGPILVTG